MISYLFETERLRVRPFHTEDAKRLYEIHAEDAVKKWIPNDCYADLEEAEEAIEFFTDCVRRGKLPFVLAAELKATGELIGDTGVNEVDGNPNEVEIGYVISEKHSGKSYASELVGAMTDDAVSRFGISVLYGCVMRGNASSVRVLEKNGYTFDREELGAEEDPYGNGMLVYRKEYKNAPANEEAENERS